jgi:exodeoxyribonuclease V alpha subunit
MIAANSYSLKLFNGDIGLIDAEDESHSVNDVAAYFIKDEKTLMKLSPSRLPAHQTAHALTVHKSQGSEFDEVLVVLPEKPSPVTTRELLYTAVSRARKLVTLMAPLSVIQHALQTPIHRSSGLRDCLDPPYG